MCVCVCVCVCVKQLWDIQASSILVDGLEWLVFDLQNPFTYNHILYGEEKVYSISKMQFKMKLPFDLENFAYGGSICKM